MQNKITETRKRESSIESAWATLTLTKVYFLRHGPPFSYSVGDSRCHKSLHFLLSSLRHCSIMEEFYKRFLQKHSEENKQYHSSDSQSKNNLQGEGPNDDSSDSDDAETIRDPTKIAFENDSLKLVVVKSQFKRQVNFKLDDHLYHLLIEPKKTVPIKLMDILDFLHAAIIHILDEIKHSYKSEEHNIAYLTLFQEPLISGLTTVKY